MQKENIRDWKQECLRKGYVKGRKEGYQQGLKGGVEVGRQSERQKILQDILEDRFGPLPKTVSLYIDSERDEQTLRSLIRSASKVDSMEAFCGQLDEIWLSQ